MTVATTSPGAVADHVKAGEWYLLAGAFCVA